MAGVTPPCSIDGAAASTSSSGSQPPAARHSRRAEPVLATDLAASACWLTTVSNCAETCASAPHDVTSRRPDTALAADLATASSPTTARRCRAAKGRSSRGRARRRFRHGRETRVRAVGSRVTHRPAASIS
jgi:hypothetical protein